MLFDQSFIDDLKTRADLVRIIHGFGTGALKNYVHHFLKNSDLIERLSSQPTIRVDMVPLSRS